MIASSQWVKMASLCLAVAAHGALALVLAAPEPPSIDGAEGATDVRLGSAFADMAMGTLKSEAQDMQAHRHTADTVMPELAAKPPPQPTADPAARPPVETLRQTRPDAAQVQRPVAASLPDMSEAVLPERMAALDATQEFSSARPDFPEQPASRVEPERLSGTEPEHAAVSRSVRPRMRTAEFEAAHKTEPAPTPKPRKSATRGNADRNVRSGDTSGSDRGTARSSGSGNQRQAAGNAAASDYPGLVMRRLSHAGKPRVDARGVAVVAFTISAGGGLASVSVARSSGSEALDRAALRVVRGAAPFPTPPAGARRSFSVRIKGS